MKTNYYVNRYTIKKTYSKMTQHVLPTANTMFSNSCIADSYRFFDLRKPQRVTFHTHGTYNEDDTVEDTW